MATVPVTITMEFVQQLMEQDAALLKQNAALTNQVDELTATVRELHQTIKELKEQINRISKNSPKRGLQGMEQCGVLADFKGTAVYDCWASYWNYPDILHAVCCAHLLRELTGISENHPEQKWASTFIDLLLEMKKVKDNAVEK